MRLRRGSVSGRITMKCAPPPNPLCVPSDYGGGQNRIVLRPVLSSPPPEHFPPFQRVVFLLDKAWANGGYSSGDGHSPIRYKRLSPSPEPLRRSFHSDFRSPDDPSRSKRPLSPPKRLRAGIQPPVATIESAPSRVLASPPDLVVGNGQMKPAHHGNGAVADFLSPHWT